MQTANLSKKRVYWCMEISDEIGIQGSRNYALCLGKGGVLN